MKVLDPGHKYELTTYDDETQGHDTIRFMKREGPVYPGNIGSHGGTNCQELIRVLIDRLKYVNDQIPSIANVHSIYHLRMVLWELEGRAAKRHGLEIPKVYDFQEIETIRTCLHCGHIVCATPRWDSQEPELPSNFGYRSGDRDCYE